MPARTVKHPLAHLIPVPDVAANYYSRKVSGTRDIDLLAYAKEVQKHVLLAGPTGPGKSTYVRAYCSEMQIPLVIINCNGGIDPNTFFGTLHQDPITKVIAWVDSDIVQVIKHGGMLMFEEVNFMHPKVSAVFHGLLDSRRSITILEKGNEVVEAHDDLQIAAAYNPEYEGTRPLNAAFKNRFAIKLSWGYSEEVEKELVCMPVMLEVAEKLRARVESGDITTPISTNMLIEFEELGVDLGLAFAIDNFVAAFHSDERPAVEETLKMFGDTISNQFKELEARSQQAEQESA